MDHTSSNVENGSNERFDVMLVAAQDAEGQCRHHDNQAANDDWWRLAYSAYMHDNKQLPSKLQGGPKLAPFLYACVATHLRCGGIFSNSIITNFLVIVTVK